MEEKIYMPRRGKRKTKEITISIAIVVIITIIILIIVSSIKKANYKKTYEYKLEKAGYSKDEITELLKQDDDFINHVLEMDYNEYILDFLKEKYYLEKNLDSYLTYKKENPNENLDKIVALINTHANNDWYTNTIKTNEDLNEKILINKFYYTDENYKPEDLVTIKNWYAYGDGQIMRQIAYDKFISMYNEAKKNDISLIINSAYRSYEDQDEVYSDYVAWYGESDANKIAAKPGYSEHQTGLAIDIVTPGYNSKTFDQSKAYEWLKNNSYKYGYIIRYPKDKDDITGYEYESWHYRYVGEDIAKYIYENNITYDEYYAYFLEDK